MLFAGAAGRVPPRDQQVLTCMACAPLHMCAELKRIPGDPDSATERDSDGHLKDSGRCQGEEAAGTAFASNIPCACVNTRPKSPAALAGLQRG